MQVFLSFLLWLPSISQVSAQTPVEALKSVIPGFGFLYKLPSSFIFYFSFFVFPTIISCIAGDIFTRCTPDVSA